MSMMQNIGTASDRVMTALISGLEIEFGRGVGEALALRFLEAEEVDFHWEARVQERWIGAYESVDEEDIELDRIAIIGRLDGEWFVAMMIVDGDGNAHGMMGRRIFGRESEARAAFAIALGWRSGAWPGVALLCCLGSLGLRGEGAGISSFQEDSA